MKRFPCGWSAAVLLALAAVTSNAEPGAARVAKWPGDAKAAFLLMFDDGWPSHWQVAAPELAKRGLTATFYINPAKGEYDKFRGQWETNVWKLGMSYGVHTMTHKGVKDLANAEWEIGECARVIRGILPEGTTWLLSYGQPGVGKDDWNITAEQLGGLLGKYHLVSRPDFRDHGAVYHLKTAADMLALADKAIANGGLEYVIFHGIERITPNWSYQDFWALKQDIFLPVLDGLVERRDRGDLWIADHIAAHRYETERDAATVRVLETTAQRVRLDLACTADPQTYDLPLTLVADVPAGWPHCRVVQGQRTAVVPVRDGHAKFEALPGGGAIALEPATP